MIDGSKTEDWHKMNPRMWEFSRRGDTPFPHDYVRCLRTLRGFNLHINYEEVAILPTWDAVLAMTPILLGIHGKVKS